MSTGVSQPWDADALANAKVRNAVAKRFDAADNFVTRYDGKLWFGEITVDDVQVRTADATGGNTDQYLVQSWDRIRNPAVAQWRPRLVQDHGLHRFTFRAS